MVSVQKKQKNEVLDVFLNTQLVILMTNLLLLFPGEHHYTSQSTASWGFYAGNRVRRRQTHPAGPNHSRLHPALEELPVHPETQQAQEKLLEVLPERLFGFFS